MQPQKIGTWTTNDVLSLPDGLGGWIYEPSDFNIRVGMYMAKYGQEDSFPYVMSNMWNKPPPVPPRFKMMWYDMVMSCVHPAIVVTGERPIHYDYGIIPVNELKFANRCVAIVSQWHQFPIVDGYMKAQRNMASYVPQAKMLGAQYPVMIGLLVMEKELRIVFETLNNYLAYMEPKLREQPFPMSMRYRRRCVANVHLKVIKTIQSLVTRGVTNTGDLGKMAVSKKEVFQSEYFLITIWDNIARVAEEVDPDYTLDHPSTSLLENTSNLKRDGQTSLLKFFGDRTPNDIRVLTTKKLSREFALDHHELYRQVPGFNFLLPRVYDLYVDSLEGTGKDLSVRRFTHASVSAMINDTDTFGPGEVDLPISDEDVHRHLSYLALRLGFPDLTRSELWTVDHPIGIEAETTDGIEGYRYHIGRRSRDESSVTSASQELKRPKLQTTIIDVESDDEDLRAWIANLPENVADMEPIQLQAYQDLTVPTTPARSEPQ